MPLLFGDATAARHAQEILNVQHTLLWCCQGRLLSYCVCWMLSQASCSLKQFTSIDFAALPVECRLEMLLCGCFALCGSGDVLSPPDDCSDLRPRCSMQQSQNI